MSHKRQLFAKQCLFLVTFQNPNHYFIYKVTDSESVFRNRLFYEPPPTDVRRDSSFDISLTCNVGFSGIISTKALTPKNRNLDAAFEGTGDFGTNFTFKFQLFRDQTYNTSYTDSDFPVEVGVTQRIYFAVAMSYSEDKELPIEVVVKDLIATPSPDPNDEKKYSFIDNRLVSCSVKAINILLAWKNNHRKILF